MPLALDPNQTYWLTLASDEKKPVDERPAFCFRYMNYRETMEVADLLDRLNNPKIGQEEKQDLPDQFLEVCRRKLVKWRNLVDETGRPIELDVRRLDEILNVFELMELVQKQSARQVPDLEDKKKSDSPSPSDTDGSVSSAPAEADASTPPPSSNPPS